jgi:pyruvate ferredoxin oxidoreductase alpha subunit
MTSDLFSTPEVVGQTARLSAVTLLAHGPDMLSETAKNIIQIDSMESDSAISAALAASALEKRTLTSVMQIEPAAMREASAMRMPLVVFAAMSPENVMALRDTGCIIIFCGSHQELMDTIICSYKLCEDHKVLLPCVILWDGPLNYMEPVDVPSDQMIRNFLPAMKLPQRLEVKKPTYLGFYENYLEIKQQQYKAMESAMKIMPVIDEQWSKKLKRSWPVAEKYKTEDAELILVTYGYHSNTARAVVDNMRAQGKKAGLLRIMFYRPFPLQDMSILKEKKVAVLDFASSPGSASPLYQEIKPLAKFALSFISLQKYLSEKDFLDIFSKLEKAEKEEMFWI